MADIKDNENNIENNEENSSENENQDDLKNQSDESKDLKKDSTEDSEKSQESEESGTEEIKSEEVKSEEVENTDPTEQELKESIYQISLADENNLKVKVLLERTINIDCYVRGERTQDFQTNKITLNPDNKNTDREIEVIISLDALQDVPSASKDSNYKINLVNDDTLKIKVTTNKLLSIDCYYKSGEEQDSQFNKIIVNPKQDLSKQDIEIFISSQESKTEKVILPEGITQEEAFEKGILVPNPEVADLINGETELEQRIPLTEEEKVEEAITKKNPFVRQREIYRRNLTRAAVTANIIFIIAIFAFYAWGSQEETPMTNPNPPRIVVLQDLPDPKINLENVADPNKPEEEPEEKETQDASVTIRKVTPRRINRPPIVRNTPTDTTTARDTSDSTGELDSIRKANQLADSLKGNDTTKTAYQIPDSLRTEYSGNEIGLRINARPISWKVIDSREMNTTIQKFNGLILADTTKPSGAMNMFIQVDEQNNLFKSEFHDVPFVMTDSTINAFKSSKPRSRIGRTNVYYYLYTKVGNLYINAEVNNELFEGYKDIIDAVVRSITIEPPKPSGEQ
ncbi:MAG TPA: hypothetical protein VHP32_05825 [Ignavibacteria bacterium]|nr:hypothetical protein [Ignavibacteria bacterium]